MPTRSPGSLANMPGRRPGTTVAPGGPTRRPTRRPNTMRPPGLSPFDIAAFRQRQVNLRDDYRRGLAANDLAYGDAEANYNNSYSGLTSDWRSARDDLPGGFAQRGVLNSGIYRQGLGDFYNQRYRAFGDLAAGYQNQQGQLNLQRLGLAQTLRGGLDQVAADQLAARAQLAAQLGQAAN